MRSAPKKKRRQLVAIWLCINYGCEQENNLRWKSGCSERWENSTTDRRRGGGGSVAAPDGLKANFCSQEERGAHTHHNE